MRASLAVALVAASSLLAACQPSVGDKCVLNTDCSISGTRQCDTSMPGGYCTVFNCGPNSCPDQSACYLFHSDVQGCPYDDRQPSRTAHSFCMKDCQHDSDCRPGYQCGNLRIAPWNAILLDDNQNQAACVPWTTTGFYEGSDDGGQSVDPICQANPDEDAAFPPEPDAGIAAADAGDGGGDASLEAGAPIDAGVDATLDAGADATVTDAGVDAADAGAPDATLD